MRKLMILSAIPIVFLFSCGKSKVNPEQGQNDRGNSQNQKENNDFNLSVNDSIEIISGTSSTFTVMVSNEENTGTVSLNFSGPSILVELDKYTHPKPADNVITYEIQPALTGFTYRLWVGKDLSSGDYNITLKGRAGSVIHTKEIVLSVIKMSDKGVESWAIYKQEAGYGKLLFRSGFEQGVSLTAIEKRGSESGRYWQSLQGTDTVSGYSWPLADNDELNLIRSYFYILVVGSDVPDVPSLGQYFNNSLQRVTGYNGKATRALYMQEYVHTSSSQAWLYLNPETDKDVKSLYYRFRMRYDNTLLQEMPDPGWNNFTFFKTVATDYRVEPAIKHINGDLFWTVKGDYVPSGVDAHPGTNAYEDGLAWGPLDNHDYPVPIGQWFTVEIYWNRSDGLDGRYFWAVNGHVIADYHGPLKRKENIDRIGLFGLYNRGSNQSKMFDDLEIWDAPPCPGLPCVMKPSQ